jgi:hypothetical protein
MIEPAFWGTAMSGQTPLNRSPHVGLTARSARANVIDGDAVLTTDQADVAPLFGTIAPTRDCDRVPSASNGRTMTWVVAVSTGLLSAPLRAEPGPDVATAASEAIRHLDLQTELPGEPTLQPKLHLSLAPELIFLALIIAAACVLYAFREQLGRWRLLGRSREWRADQPESGEDLPARSVLEATVKADELAGQGRFVEAMHLLLLHSLSDLRQRLGVEFADSLTSREILRNAQLSDPNRTLLRDIVARVEWCYFGGYPAALADYVACRHSFDALFEAVHADNGG